MKPPVNGAINDCTGPKSETKRCNDIPCDISKYYDKVCADQGK